MSEYLIYLVKASSYLVIFYLVFYFFLRKLTFHQLNRFILLLILFIVVLIPFFPIINSPYSLPQNVFELVNFEDNAGLLANNYNESLKLENAFIIKWIHLIILTYWLGFIFALSRFFGSIIKLFKLKKNAARYMQGNITFFIADISTVFSFGNWIFIPIDKPIQEAPIIEHEKAHARYKHVIDLIAIELYIVIFWFNPFVYFIRKSLRSIHEFQADQAVIKKDFKKSLYLDLLLKELTTNRTVKLYSYFNQPIIKNRVEMITKPSSNRKNKLKYFLLIPTIVLLLMAFTRPKINAVQFKNRGDDVLQNSTPIFLFPIPSRSFDDIVASFGIEGLNSNTQEIDKHGGIDIKGVVGESVIATNEGVISTASFKPDWGNLIIINHADGYQTWYAHLNEINVAENQKIDKGTIIGTVGHSGQAKSDHLHYEIRHKGERLNPIDLTEK